MSRGDLGHIVELVADAANRHRTDRDLLERFVTGQDQTAFAVLVARYGPLVLGVGRRVLGDAHEAEDVFQATFLILARKAAAVRWQESVRNWLYQVASRVAREARARRARRQRHERAAAALPRADGESELTWQEVRGVLDEELSRLPEKYRAPLVLCYLQGKTRDEAAEQLGWVVGAVKKRLEVGRNLLRQRLIRRGLRLSAALLATLLAKNLTPAAVPALALVAAVRAGVAFAAGQTGSVPAPALSLAQGVLSTMFVSKLKFGAAVLALALIAAATGTGLLFRATMTAAPLDPSRPPTPKGAVEPGQVAVSKPDKNGLVTMLRPLVTRLAPGDPLRIALHWATENGPIERDPPGGNLLRDDTLNSMTFTVTVPGGKRHALQAKVKPTAGLAPLSRAPTYVLTLTEKGIAERDVTSGPWADNHKGLFDVAGVYHIQVGGSLVRDQGDAIPFESGRIAVELGSTGIKTLAEVETAARDALERKRPDLKPGKPTVILEDKAGNRLVRFASEVRMWSYTQYVVEVSPDGTPGADSQREIHTCVACGTLLEGEKGPVAVETVREGDRVWGYDLAAKEKALTTVRLVRRGKAAETLVFGETLRVTATHPLWAGGVWKRAGEVQEDDALLTSDLRSVPAGVGRPVVGAIDVFDLTVDGPHNFFAGGFLVHNKDRPYSPNLDDLWYRFWPLPEPKK
jgi:RNA polymerase sigma factor (sigma-70 family)